MFRCKFNQRWSYETKRRGEFNSNTKKWKHAIAPINNFYKIGEKTKFVKNFNRKLYCLLLLFIIYIEMNILSTTLKYQH